MLDYILPSAASESDSTAIIAAIAEAKASGVNRVRIPREKESLQHPQLPGLYPCGEGAGYAGGIVSAALDGRRCAEAIAQS